jgi:hypothetical protein
MTASRLGFWSNIAGLAAAVATLIGFGTGSITVAGTHFWSSPVFVTVFSMIAIILLTASMDYLTLNWLKSRLASRDYRLMKNDLPPGALILLSYCYWVPLFILWGFATFALNDLGSGRPSDAAGFLLTMTCLFLLPGGGVAIAAAVYELDKLFSPWTYGTGPK